MYHETSLFYNPEQTPLADRVRPLTLDEFIGQDHLIGENKVLRNLIESDKVTSMIFWGPPGVGKTTLAMIISKMTKAKFVNFSAVTSGIKEIKEVMEKARQNRVMGEKTILFVDEIHRFNKAQQDAFLPHVEKGNIILIGATTENPSFEINAALLSRCRVFVLNPLTEKDITELLRHALKIGFNDINTNVDYSLLQMIATYANGDARTALNVLEMTLSSSKINDGVINVTKKTLEECLQKKTLLYDKNGEHHYNLISALHKSMRNSDPDAAIYWLARMLEAGENPLYIARRLIRFASEDIGLADPKALESAIHAYQASHYNGMPECNVNLTQAVVYLAIAPKSNALYKAYEKARADASQSIAEDVPLHLRNAPTKLMKDLGYSKNYQYAHDHEDKITSMECLPNNLKDRTYYNPVEAGVEKKIKERLNFLKQKRTKL